MQSSPRKRLVVLGYFGLLFLLSALRGWSVYQDVSTPPVCTEGACNQNFDYAAAGMGAGTMAFLGAFLGGVLVFLVVWGIYKTWAGRRRAAA